MVDMIIRENMFLINAPAGSGKTTTIYNDIITRLKNETYTKVLCITFTNRAVNEIKSKITNNNVEIATIHSFMSNFFNRYFSFKKIIDLYCECFDTKIKEKIKDYQSIKLSEIEENNYKIEFIKEIEEKYSDFNEDSVKKNISKIRYMQSKNSSYLRGGLGHDDLLKFCYYIITKLPIIKDRIHLTYKYIYIDEYQDTFDDVLKFFYDSVKDTDTKLFLYGDPMQQIYKNYKGYFENEFREFNKTIRLSNNYRSSKKIVDMLNKLYNDGNFEQVSNNSKIDENKYNEKPRIIVYNGNLDELKEYNDLKDNDKCLKLYLTNSKRFNSIGANALYLAFNKTKRYGINSAVNAGKILLENFEDNSDELLKLVFEIYNIYLNYINKNYGGVITILKEKERYGKHKFYNSDILIVKKHNDKVNLKAKLDEFVDYYENKTDKKIKELFNKLIELKILNNKKVEELEKIKDLDNETVLYESALNVPLIEYKNVIDQIKNLTVSTQHGVKGESYDEVLFVTEDSSKGEINIKIYKAFEIMSKYNVSLTKFQSTYYKLKNDSFFGDLEKINEKNENKEKVLKSIDNLISELKERFRDNVYFEFWYNDCIQPYLNSKTKKNIQKIKLSYYLGMLNAYKLFYVGCSRARYKLTIFVQYENIKNFYNEFCDKFGFADKKSYGFKIIDLNKSLADTKNSIGDNNYD